MQQIENKQLNLFKRTKYLNRHLTKEDILMPNKHVFVEI